MEPTHIADDPLKIDEQAEATQLAETVCRIVRELLARKRGVTTDNIPQSTFNEAVADRHR